MAIRPILFSGPMVRALLDGRKTQTRRALIRNVIANIASETAEDLDLQGWEIFRGDDDALCAARLPYGVGDLLWVREAWKPHSIYAGMKPRDIPKSKVFYRAGEGYSPSNTPWKPGIHMPRWASRITLKVTGVKIERLNDISAEDCEAEGIESEAWDMCAGYRDYTTEDAWFYTWPGAFLDNGLRFTNPKDIQRRCYRSLWDSINGPGSWEANPWVVAVSFVRKGVT